MIFKVSNLHKFFFTYICPRFYGGSPPSTPSQTTQTVNQNTIPAELMPYVKNMLNRAEPLSQAAYVPYSTNAQDYIAPFSPLQKKAQEGAANLQTPGQFAPASQMAGLSGLGSMTAGAQYAQQATNPNAVGAYMNPYLQQSLAPQLQLLNQQYGIEQAKQQGAATQAGAFGGSREALMSGLNSQNQNLAQQKMISEGYNQAFNQAQQAQQFGATLGLQGYGQGIQAAGQLGQLGTQQLAAEQGVLGTQSQFGGQQQAQQQQAIDQAVQNYQNAQNYPYMQLGFMSNLLRGTPINNTTETQYMAQPSAMQQIGGALGTAGSLYGAYTAKKAEGGIIQDDSYAKGGIVGYLEGGSIEESMRSKLEDLDISHLQQIIQSNESPEMSKLAKEVLATKFAKGGIVAFAKGGTPPNVLRNPAYYEDVGDYTLEDLAAESDPEVRASRIEEWNRKYGKPKAIEPIEAEYIQPETTKSNLSENEALKTLKNKPKGLATIPGEDVVRPPANEGILTRRGTGLATIPGEGPTVDRLRTAQRHPLRVSKEQEAWDRERLAQDSPKTGTAETTTPKSTAWTEEPVGNFGEKVKEGIKGVGSKAKSIAKGLMSAEVLAPVAMEERAAQFKTDEGGALTKGIEAVEAGPSVALEALQRAALGGSTAEQFRKASPKLAAFIDATGKTVEDRFNAVKDYFSGELSAEEKALASKAEAQNVATDMGFKPPATPFISEGLNGSQAQTPAQQPAQQPAVTPPVGSAGQGIVQKEQSSFGGTPEESEILRANLASEPESVAQAVNTAAEVANAKTEQDMGFYQKQVAEMYKQAGLGNNEGAAAMRKEIMGELANKEANEKRQTYLRMAEFFAHWGSTPGAPLAAGMRSLIATMPGYLEDKKDQEKLQRGLQDSLYKLDQADRLEKIGMIKEAAALKHEASQFDKEVMKLQHEAVQNRLQEAAAERRAKIMAGASTTNAVIGATSRIDGTVSDTYRGNNIKALQNQATNITRQMANLLPESKELPGLKAQLKNVNDRMDTLIDESGAKPKTRYDRWLTETGKI